MLLMVSLTTLSSLPALAKKKALEVLGLTLHQTSFLEPGQMSLLKVLSDTNYNAGREMKGDEPSLTFRNNLWFPDASGDVVSVKKR